MSDREIYTFKENEDPVYLIVKTKVPTKWMLIDRETGQVYLGNEGGYWDKLKSVERLDK